MELFNPFKNLAVFLYYATIQTVLKGWCFICTARYHNHNKETVLLCFMYILINSWQPANYFTYELIKKEQKKNGIARGFGGGGQGCSLNILLLCHYFSV